MEIKPEDLKIESFGDRKPTYTNSKGELRPPPTVRVTHLPTGLSEECSEHFSQHKNREAALKQLRERLEKI